MSCSKSFIQLHLVLCQPSFTAHLSLMMYAIEEYSGEIAEPPLLEIGSHGLIHRVLV